MLEIFGIIALCKLNKKNAIARGRRPGGYIALTISLWVGLEILGAFVAGIYSGITGNELGYGYLFFAYGFAGIGALISFLCAKFGPKATTSIRARRYTLRQTDSLFTVTTMLPQAHQHTW